MSEWEQNPRFLNFVNSAKEKKKKKKEKKKMRVGSRVPSRIEGTRKNL